MANGDLSSCAYHLTMARKTQRLSAVAHIQAAKMADTKSLD
jgi:hypothetical protein